MAKKDNSEIQTKFIELRAKGFSYDRISQELHTAKQTLINWGYQYETEISNLRQLELESLQEQFLFTHGQRIQLLGEMFKRLNAELETRDLKDVPTDKLLSMFLKCLDFLKSESPDLVFRQRGAFDDMDFASPKKWVG